MNCTMCIIRLRELYYTHSTIFLRECGGRPRGLALRKRCKTGRRAEGSPPYRAMAKVMRRAACPHAAAMVQRGDFEEVPRLAATTVAASRLARRWAREPRPYGGIQGVREKNPPVTASPCQPPLGKGAEGADCHSQCAHWLRNDMAFTWGAVRRADRGVRPYGGLQGVPVCGPMWASAPTEALQEMRRMSWRAG